MTNLNGMEELNKVRRKAILGYGLIPAGFIGMFILESLFIILNTESVGFPDFSGRNSSHDPGCCYSRRNNEKVQEYL